MHFEAFHSEVWANNFCHQFTSLTDLEEDHEEGGDKIVDALDVSRGGVADGPDVEDPLHHLLHQSHVSIVTTNNQSESSIVTTTTNQRAVLSPPTTNQRSVFTCTGLCWNSPTSGDMRGTSIAICLQ